MPDSGQQDQEVVGDAHGTSASPAPAPSNNGDHKRYWASNLKIVGVLLAIWFAVSYGAGILFAEQLNAFRLPGTGFKLGFWFAQQGSIVIFVLLITAYVLLMARLDKRHGVEEN